MHSDRNQDSLDILEAFSHLAGCRIKPWRSGKKDQVICNNRLGKDIAHPGARVVLNCLLVAIRLVWVLFYKTMVAKDV